MCLGKGFQRIEVGQVLFPQEIVEAVPAELAHQFVEKVDERCPMCGELVSEVLFDEGLGDLYSIRILIIFGDSACFRWGRIELSPEFRKVLGRMAFEISLGKIG